MERGSFGGRIASHVTKFPVRRQILCVAGQRGLALVPLERAMERRRSRLIDAKAVDGLF